MDQLTNTLPVASPPKPFPQWPFIALFSFFLGIASILVYQKYLPARTLLVGSSPSPVAVLPSPSLDPIANWKTFTNSNYSIFIQYPERFNLKEELNNNDYYETIGSFESQYGETMFIKIIKDVDIYNQTNVVEVAMREIMDSGYKYDITVTKVSDYSAAITTLNDQNTSPLTVTIAHPTKNLFVVLTLPRDLSKTEFDLILSTFKFLGESSTPELLNIKFNGGLCPDGNECSSTKTIMQNGSVLINNKLKTKTDLTKLTSLINTVNFDEIRSKKFTGTCPTAYDGQEAIYTFYTSTGVQTISSCEFEIDNQSLLFSEINQIFSNLPNEK